MTREDLARCDAELKPLALSAEASALAREHAGSFNESVAQVRAALLEPAADLLERGLPLHELPRCLEKAVAELAFWRRVLQRMHGAELGPEPGRPEYLVRFLTS
jgi:hypothetical protein